MNPNNWLNSLRSSIWCTSSKVSSTKCFWFWAQTDEITNSECCYFFGFCWHSSIESNPNLNSNGAVLISTTGGRTANKQTKMENDYNLHGTLNFVAEFMCTMAMIWTTAAACSPVRLSATGNELKKIDPISRYMLVLAVSHILHLLTFQININVHQKICALAASNANSCAVNFFDVSALVKELKTMTNVTLRTVAHKFKWKIKHSALLNDDGRHFVSEIDRCIINNPHLPKTNSTLVTFSPFFFFLIATFESRPRCLIRHARLKSTINIRIDKEQRPHRIEGDTGHRLWISVTSN